MNSISDLHREQVYIQYLVIVLWVFIVTFCKMKTLLPSMKLPALDWCLETVTLEVHKGSEPMSEVYGLLSVWGTNPCGGYIACCGYGEQTHIEGVWLVVSKKNEHMSVVYDLLSLRGTNPCREYMVCCQYGERTHVGCIWLVVSTENEHMSGLYGLLTEVSYLNHSSNSNY